MADPLLGIRGDRPLRPPRRSTASGSGARLGQLDARSSAARSASPARARRARSRSAASAALASRAARFRRAPPPPLGVAARQLAHSASALASERLARARRAPRRACGRVAAPHHRRAEPRDPLEPLVVRCSVDLGAAVAPARAGSRRRTPAENALERACPRAPARRRSARAGSRRVQRKSARTPRPSLVSQTWVHAARSPLPLHVLERGCPGHQRGRLWGSETTFQTPRDGRGDPAAADYPRQVPGYSPRQPAEVPDQQQMLEVPRRGGQRLEVLERLAPLRLALGAQRRAEHLLEQAGLAVGRGPETLRLRPGDAVAGQLVGGLDDLAVGVVVVALALAPAPAARSGTPPARRSGRRWRRCARSAPAV